MTPSDASPLAGLIERHRAGRTYPQLAEACGGVISASCWEDLEQVPLRRQVPLDPVVIEALAVAPSLSEGMVRHYALASRDLPTGGLR
jgi:hypothetical protein